MKFKELINNALFAFRLPIKPGIVLIGNLTILIIALQFSLSSLSTYHQTETVLSQNYYRIFDNFTDNNETKSSDFLIRIKSLYKKLVESPQLTFLDISNQQALIENSFHVSDYLIADYDKGKPLSNIKFSNTETVFNGYKSIQMDRRSLVQFNLMNTLPNDINWSGDLSTSSTIPILLGNDFKTSIIDEKVVFKARYLNIPISFKVVGYLSKDSHFYNGESMINLDRQIILPAIEYTAGANTEEELRNQKRIYLEKINGILITSETRGVAQSIVSGICAEAMVPTLSVQGALSGEPVFKMQASEFAKVLLLLSAILTVFAVIGLILTLIQDMSRNFAKFAVHLLCGATIGDIYRICFVRYLLTCTASILSSIFIANLIIPLENTIVFICCSSIIFFCIIFMLFPRRIFGKKSIGSLLRRNDE